VQAAALDAAHASTAYRAALETARQRLAHPDLTPSARILAAMGREFEGSYVRFIRRRSDQTLADLMALPFSEKQRARYEAMALDSLLEQARIEATDTEPFESFRQRYLDPQTTQA
jgi:glutamate--cysteine ligase